jgi:putative ABC transport system permease protein
MDSSQSHIRLFRALLYCYPGEFRHEYGAEMEQLFTDRLHAESRLKLWLQTLADIAFTAPAEHVQILFADLKYALRTLSAVPAFTAVALAVLATGIGATVAIFSLVNAVLLRSLPYGHPDELVYLWSPNPTFKGVPAELSPNVPDIYVWQRLNHSFSSITMLRRSAESLIRPSSSIRVEVASVTPNFFATMQVWPAVGPTFNDQSSRVALISHSLWHSQFNADKNIIGRRLQLNRNRFTIVGIMPAGFGYPYNGDIPFATSELQQTDIWLPMTYTPAQKTDRVNFQSPDAAIGRLRPGTSISAAQSELKLIQSHLDPLYPPMWRGFTAIVRSLPQTILGPVQQLLWLLLGAVAFVLLIAISNVAGLLFARADTRAHELGIRTALGAQQARIIRELLTESLLLSVTGGALGLALAYAAVHILAMLNPGDIPRFDTVSVDADPLLVAVLLSIATGILSGLIPALTSSRFTINELLRKGGSRVTGTFNQGRVILIVTQVALSVILLSGSALLIRSYLRLSEVDPGFSPSTLTFELPLDAKYNSDAVRAQFYRSYLDKLRAMPGVKFVGASSATPLTHHESVTFADIRGFGRAKQVVENFSVTPDYFNALGTPYCEVASLILKTGRRNNRSPSSISPSSRPTSKIVIPWEARSASASATCLPVNGTPSSESWPTSATINLKNPLSPRFSSPATTETTSLCNAPCLLAKSSPKLAQPSSISTRRLPSIASTQ